MKLVYFLIHFFILLCFINIYSLCLFRKHQRRKKRQLNNDEAELNNGTGESTQNLKNNFSINNITQLNNISQSQEYLKLESNCEYIKTRYPNYNIYSSINNGGNNNLEINNPGMNNNMMNNNMMNNNMMNNMPNNTNNYDNYMNNTLPINANISLNNLFNPPNYDTEYNYGDSNASLRIIESNKNNIKKKRIFKLQECFSGENRSQEYCTQCCHIQLGCNIQAENCCKEKCIFDSSSFGFSYSSFCLNYRFYYKGIEVNILDFN